MSELIQRAIELPWGYIMFTLLIRFVGVFVVLAILMIGMYLLGFVVSRLVARQEERKTAKLKPEMPDVLHAEDSAGEPGDEEVVAAIGAAIALSMQQAPSAYAGPSPEGGITAGPWALAGRATQMNSRLQGGSYRHS
jgi:Na+-transporting methylmalonyl-CoA/oxaloacetate decarboxylase gamma subunit